MAQEDPLQVHGARPKASNHSPLMQRKIEANRTGKVANLCPFGCRDHELDDFGYCRHLVGFTRPEDGMRPGRFEPMIDDPDDTGKMGRKKIDGQNPRPLERGDKLIRTTNAYRVYRDVGPAPAPAEPDELTVGDLTDEQLELATRPQTPATGADEFHP